MRAYVSMICRCLEPEVYIVLCDLVWLEVFKPWPHEVTFCQTLNYT